ncbi:serine hydrolase domain-containing protein [Pseudomarimonas arenosa]|uniref:Serine hydrolase n=1 Tax=Pseudomarimonas arenosa TaxID=2774145 RepID=A0AAW3ZM67_9GAMM|nr:serine hydrolase domain-containing protein [Pseudomarimonas arenosa]MBD8527053.1 serine hydrolase [Pseudomarimonas arenosa]
MRLKSIYLACALLCSSLSAPAVDAATPQQAAGQLQEFLAGLPDLGPGYAVTVVTADEVVLQHTQGLRNSATKALLTVDTPIYIASQTKAYMGLLAHLLDRRGVLPLNTPLNKHWPQLKLPDGLDPADWTLADLLNHRLPIEADEITYLEAYVTELDYRQYPDLIEYLAKKRDPGFLYDNLGYNIYAAILHQATGKPWQDWLQEAVFKPLKLNRSSARTSDFPAAELSFNHSWLGEAKGWELIAPKPDPLMQSAGGMMTSPADMGRWLQWQLGAQHGGSEFGAELRQASQTGVEYPRSSRNAYELPCDGYAFGWNVCDFEGHRLYIHGGGYTGARTMMAFSPDLGVGIGVFSNSDNATGWLTSRTVVMYLQFLIEHKDAAAWAKTRQEIYPERIAQLLELRQAEYNKARQNDRWNGWRWAPTQEQLAEFVGTYQADQLPLSIAISLVDNQLQLKAGSLQRQLEAADQDLFGAHALALQAPEALRFERDADGRLIGLHYQEQRFLRRP